MVHSFVCPIIRSFIQIIFVQPLCCRNSDGSFIHNTYSSFIHMTIHRSFIRTIHRSFIWLFTIHQIVHSHYSLFIVRSYKLFIVHCSFIQFIHCSSFVHRSFIWTIHRSSDRSYGLFIVHRIIHPTIHRSSDRPNCSPVMPFSSPKTYQTNISVIWTPVTLVFLLVRTSRLVTHPRLLQV
jgi:hypothetical protein